MSRLLLFVSLPLYLLDQVTKHYIVAHYALNGEETTVVPGFFWVHHTANTGVAFGMGNGQWWANYLFGFISLAAAIVITVLVKKGAFPGPFSRTAAALLYAGIAGNFTDRLLHGYVVDFLRFDLKLMMWPSFNVADSCVVVAAVLLAVSSFLETPPATLAKSK
ncbi:MAG: peptidase signal peptidase [Verrucomicrobiaceae bacterium]|nr:peptidase signal peptidase [Verrucomicrobiaceae bacterium]